MSFSMKKTWSINIVFSFKTNICEIEIIVSVMGSWRKPSTRDNWKRIRNEIGRQLSSVSQQCFEQKLGLLQRTCTEYIFSVNPKSLNMILTILQGFDEDCTLSAKCTATLRSDSDHSLIKTQLEGVSDADQTFGPSVFGNNSCFFHQEFCYI